MKFIDSNQKIWSNWFLLNGLFGNLYNYKIFKNQVNSLLYFRFLFMKGCVNYLANFEILLIKIAF